MKKTYRTICISDVHLGTRDCKAEALDNFLKHNTCETLYMVGDILDVWRIQQNKMAVEAKSYQCGSPHT